MVICISCGRTGHECDESPHSVGGFLLCASMRSHDGWRTGVGGLTSTPVPPANIADQGSRCGDKSGALQPRAAGIRLRGY
jgi:hypothetical protein